MRLWLAAGCPGNTNATNRFRKAAGRLGRMGLWDAKRPEVQRKYDLVETLRTLAQEVGHPLTPYGPGVYGRAPGYKLGDYRATYLQAGPGYPRSYRLAPGSGGTGPDRRDRASRHPSGPQGVYDSKPLDRRSYPSAPRALTDSEKTLTLALSQ